MNKTDASMLLAGNVRRLMDANSDSQASLAARAKVSQRAIGDLMTYGRSHFKNPTLKTIEGIAIAYGVPVWVLMLPDAPIDLLNDSSVPSLVEGFVSLGPVGRAAVQNTLSQETRYQDSRPAQKKTA